ncbi:MAG TPA: alpha/beta hydrolase [Candidatus Angelobacter sp.]|nr:alpha/beta hydrolase [Candidatus Angelobacter sp.]
MKRLLLGIILSATLCLAKEPPAPKVVDLTAADGIKLKASYFSSGKPGPGVLLLHQCDHDRRIWDGLAQQLAAAGISVVTMDLRGFGESGDKPHNPPGSHGPIEPPEEMQKWPGDIDVAYRYLKSQPGVKAGQIGVGGGSCGVDNAIKTVMRHPELKSLVLLSGPTDLKGRQFLRQSKLPVFFAVADDDQYPLMVSMTELLYTISASPGKKFVRYKTGHHAAEIFSVHPDLPQKIVTWYVTTLIKNPGHAPESAEAPAIPAEVREMALLDETGGPAQLEKTLSAERQKDPKGAFIPENFMLWMAGEHLQAKDTAQALEIVKLNAAAYPDSPNSYDALGEVYLAAGKKELALQNTRKALALLPKDTHDSDQMRDSIKASAEERLKKLDATQ